MLHNVCTIDNHKFDMEWREQIVIKLNMNIWNRILKKN